MRLTRTRAVVIGLMLAVTTACGGNAGSEATGGRTAAPIARRVMETYVRGGG